MTAPLVPVDTDLRDFHFMPLDVARLVNSDLAALASGDEFKAAVMLWCQSWHQIPASSIPDDDRMLCHLAGYGRDIKGWRRVKEIALRGFVRCDDGRLYHPVIAEKVIEALEAKRKQRERTANATRARLERAKAADVPRNVERNEQRDVPRNENRNVHQGTGTGTIVGEVVARARDPDADLEAKLRTASGWQNEPAPNLAVIGPIRALLDNGADLELDVLPVVKALAPRATSRTSWNYFIAAIARARDTRIEAATVISMPTATVRNINGPHRKKPSRAETFDAIRRRIDEIADAEANGEAAGAGHGSPRDIAEGEA